MTLDSPLHIESFCLGQWMTNCYVVEHVPSKRCWIVDAGFDPDPLIQYVIDNALEPSQVVLTHAHVDHIAGLAAVRAKWSQLPILVHPAEQAALSDPAANLSAILPEPISAPPATGALEPGEIMELGDLAFEIRHTPGHSPGGITLYSAAHGVALVGDALFAGSIGRTDFPTSVHDQLIRAITKELLSLPDDTQVLSGHGPPTTIGQERLHNPFLVG